MINLKVGILKKLFFSGILTIILIIVSEIILSYFQIFPNDFYTATPNSSFVWKINSEQIAGIEGDAQVSFDELGSRSISNFKNKEHKIVALGGSTTACFALSQKKTWTALLEEKLGETYWVGNFGRPGNSSNHHVLQFEYILKKKELKDVKTVLIMQGGNDFVGYLISPKKYLDNTSGAMWRAAFKHLPNDAHTQFKEKLAFYKLLKNAKRNISFYRFNGTLTQKANEIKLLRKEAKMVEKLPSLEISLKHYEENIQKIIDKAKERNLHVVFITQATLWKPNLEKAYDDLLITSGFKNNTSFYTPSALSTGMIFFNERLKKVCLENSVDCIDLEIPKTTEAFYDDLHFNESGAKLVSNQIHEFLRYK